MKNDPPKCIADLELAQFQCNGDESKEKMHEMMGKFKEFMKDKTTEQKAEIKACNEEVANKATEKVPDIPEKCVTAFNEMKEKMMKHFE